MNRRAFLALTSATALAACGGTPSQTPVGADGRPKTKVYRISAGSANRIQYRILDSVNALRQAAGAPTLKMNSKLNAAAATHSRDMSVQNRPWHFGSDGSSPIDRVQRAGYSGRLVGETISETFETELQTLSAWMEEPTTRAVILDPTARDLGFSWHQEKKGKIWWTMVLGSPELAPTPGVATAFPGANTIAG